MKRIAIIGLGTIARHHLEALQHIPDMRVVGLCDLRKEAAQEPCYAGIPFDSDWTRLVENVQPDTVLILTPPQAHRALAELCMGQGLEVIIEKPLAATSQDVLSLLQTPGWTAVYHSICGPEVRWWETNRPQQPIDAIRIAFSDPYADEQGRIQKAKRVLGGSWLDSGVNALALLALWVPLEQMRDSHISHLTDPTCGLHYRSDFKANAGLTAIEIEVRWDKGINHKQTVIETGGHTYVLNHSRQSVECDGKVLFQDESCERLTAQYTAFYANYPQLSLPIETTEQIYKILFDNL